MTKKTIKPAKKVEIGEKKLATLIKAALENSLSMEEIKNLPIEIKILAIFLNGLKIGGIENPSLMLQLIAVWQTPEAIKVIKNPHQIVKNAINKKPWIIGRDGVALSQLRGISKNIFDINPDEEIEEINLITSCFIKNKFKENIEKPSLLLQIILVLHSGLFIRYIPKPSKEIQILAILRNIYAMADIEDPAEVTQLLAVIKEGLFISKIKKPSTTLKLIAVGENGRVIKGLENPSEEVKSAAINQNPSVISIIEDTSLANEIQAFMRAMSSKKSKAASSKLELAVASMRNLCLANC